MIRQSWNELVFTILERLADLVVIRLLMLVDGTFTGSVEAFSQAKGVINFSAWTKRISGLIITFVGAWFTWQAY